MRREKIAAIEASRLAAARHRRPLRRRVLEFVPNLAVTALTAGVRGLNRLLGGRNV